ncbi:hypothetical protein V497_09282 [Pseudogymnoascus sp. VKM F-4516 (FW-969)]|nr:hypothetical protein V497_09282 [Pseudogymnoascus sp. VKM F-4516 (FW-969)]
MQRSRNGAAFSFVEYEGPKLSQDPAVRRLIRQHAMKDVAIARRQRGNYGKHNLRQMPIFVEMDHQNEGRGLLGDGDTDSTCADTIHCDCSPDSLQDQIPKRRPVDPALWNVERSVPRSLRSFAGMAMSPDSVLLLQMMPLTGLRLGTDIYSHLHLSTELGKGGDMFSSSYLGSRKLLSFIPSRYGEVSSLSHATDCVVAKLRQMITHPDHRHPNSEALVLMHYTKALKALQADLSDKNQWMKPETLCAAELLGAFEMLDGSSEPRSWIHHVGGATRLIEARGSHRFDTEFEIALLFEHIGPSVMEAMLTNTTCFLADDKWLQVLRTAIRNEESPSDQQDLTLTLWGSLVTGPQVFKDATDIILSPEPVEQKVIDQLVANIVRARWHLLQLLVKLHEQSGMQDETPGWFEDGLAFTWPRIQGGRRSPAYSKQLALQGTCLMCRLFKARLLYALEPARFYHLEVQCQEIAERIMALERHSPDEEGMAVWNVSMSQCTWIAKGILETKEMWSDGCQNREGMIEKWKFQAWCVSIGRSF